jgi:hypothetical protein
MLAPFARIAGIARLYRPLVLLETQRALHPSMLHPFSTHIAFLLTTAMMTYHTQVNLDSSFIGQSRRIGLTQCWKCPRSEKAAKTAWSTIFFPTLPFYLSIV